MEADAAMSERCESRHEFWKLMPGVEFRCLHPAGHDGDHYAWIGMTKSHDLYWNDDGTDLDVAMNYHDRLVLQ